MATFEIPHGVIWPNGDKSPHTFNAKPCIVIQCRTPTPIDAILRSSTQTPVNPARRCASISNPAKNSISKAHSAEPVRHNRRDSPRRVLHPRKRVPPETIKLDAHICAAPGIPNRAVSWARKWVSAMARASAESASGVSVNPSNARIINAT